MVLPALALALCAGLAALGHVDRVPLGIVRAAGGLVVFGGAAWPILVRWTPREPSLLKLLVFSSLISVPLVGVIAGGVQRMGGQPLVWPVTLGCVALLQLSCLRGALRVERMGRAVVGVLAISLTVAGFWAGLLIAAGNGIRIEADGAIWQAGVARSLLRGGGLENPWLAGSLLQHHPGPAALVATVAGALHLAPTLAAALIDIWCLALLPFLLYLLAAPLWGEWRRTLLASILGWVGWSAPGVLEGFLDANEPAQAQLFLPGGGGGASMVFVFGAWLAAAHALRHGLRPWVGLCALCHGLAFCLYPPLGACGALATAMASGLGRRTGHSQLILALGLGLLPGLYLVSRFGWASSPQVGSALRSGSLATVIPMGLPLLMACAGLVSRGPNQAKGLGGQVPDRVLLLRWLWICAALPLVAVEFAPRWAESALGQCSGLTLGILAAGSLVGAWDRGGAWRGFAFVFLFLTLGCGGWATVRNGAALRVWAGEGARVLEQGVHLTPEFKSPVQAPGDGSLSKVVVATPEEQEIAREAQRRHLAQAYRWLREEFPFRDRAPILVRRVRDAAQGPVVPDPATLYADMPLWVDRFAAAAAGHSSWETRHVAAHAMYNRTDGVTISRLREVRALGRPVVFVVTEEDRLRTRGFIEAELARWGILECRRVESVTLFCWAPADAGEVSR